MQNARRSLREALTGAARGGFLRKIVDSAPPVRTLFLESYRATASQTNEIDVFAKKAINIISANTSAERKDEDQQLGATGAGDAPLTPKEREILTLVAGGLQNREIGERLGITEGTVKWHMQQIFMKLGVRRRAQAISVLHGSS
jgi:LuxR family maltose regulon positive regulatory protein